MTIDRTIALVALCIAVGGCAAGPGAGSSGRSQYLGSHPWDIASLDAASRTALRSTDP